jgi:hypothetical protein
VCTAGVAEDGTVVRPMPYLSSDKFRELNIHPGGILRGDLVLSGGAVPHVEDASYRTLEFEGPCSAADFQNVLERTAYPSISEGFGVQINSGQKCIPITTPPVRSLITIKVNPRSFAVVQNSFDPTKLKAHFSDGHGTEMSFISVTDRGFYDYTQQHSSEPAKFAEISNYIHSQHDLYLRIGLSRAFTAGDGRNGFWIQLNGIYTFPNYLKYVRCYE